MVEINDRDIGLALSNNLMGYVPLGSISPLVNKKIENFLATDGGEEKHQKNSSQLHNLNLHNYVRFGQYLRAYVISTTDTQKDGAGSKKHIELSINPSLANAGLTEVDLVENVSVQASVESVEDHGMIVNLGMHDTQIKGFLSLRAAESNVLQNLGEGSVTLCTVSEPPSENSIVKLKACLGSASKEKLTPFSNTPSSNAFLPGTAVDMQVSALSDNGVKGKLLGEIDVTADFIHSGSESDKIEYEQKYQIGSTFTARITFVLNDHEKQIYGVSLLHHILHMMPPAVDSRKGPIKPFDVLKLSSFVEKAKIVRVDPSRGLSLDLGVAGVPGYCHISRISDNRIKSLSHVSSKYKVGSLHRARAIGFSPMDGVFYMSMEKSVLTQPYLTAEEVKPGEKVRATVEKLSIDDSGFHGLRLKLAEGIYGAVSLMHLSDVNLQHPERKYREGQEVIARVLNTSPRTKRINMTLKKSLVNSEDVVWTDYRQIGIGDRSRGTITKLLDTGAIVNFYGRINAFLPISEMSEAFVDEPAKHFRAGQTVSVRVLSILPEERNMIVSCITSIARDENVRNAFETIKIGSVVSGTVLQKTDQALVITLKQSGLIGLLNIDHLSESTAQKNRGLFQSFRIGQILNNLMIYNKFDKKPMVELSSKSSLVKKAQEGQLITEFSELREGLTIHGIIRNITEKGVFINTPGNLTGLLPISHVPKNSMHLPSFGFRIGQAATATVLAIDVEQQRFLLSMRNLAKIVTVKADRQSNSNEQLMPLSDPVDVECKSVSDYTFGRITTARILAVKETQLNVALASGVQGRVDVSEIFEDWEDIKDRKHPLKSFKPKQILPVQILGMHDAKTHRYLPISHRNATMPVFELTAKVNQKLENATDLLSLDKIAVGASCVGFVNNVTDQAVWVNLSPNVRGRIDIMDLSDDVSRLDNVHEIFPVGSAIKLKVKNVDTATNRLDLVAKKSLESAVSIESVQAGSILPGRITKVTENQLLIQLSDAVVGSATLTDLADDYALANPAAYNKNDVVRVCVTGVEVPSKRVYLSLRPSQVLSSNLAVMDPHILSIKRLEESMIVRGFVKNVTDKGVFISLGSTVTAFVRICDLSDKYIKDWKSIFTIGKLIKGRVTSIDHSLNHVQLNLKESIVDDNYVPPITFNDVRSHQILTGTIRKVEDYGVFIVVDNSANVSGLCHRSEIADKKVENVKKLYSEGDKVKAKVLKIDMETRRINFGLKATYFDGDTDDKINISNGNDEKVALPIITSDVDLDGSNRDSFSEGDDEDGGVGLESQLSHSSSLTQPFHKLTNHRDNNTTVDTLEVSGFDWTGGTLEESDEDKEESANDDTLSTKKKRRRKSQILVDKTGDLDLYGPQSDVDFERQLLADPNSSSLWVQYMALQLQLSEIDKARQIAERALRTIHIREVEEKQNVWIAMLNLENTFGSDDSVEDVFKRACQYNDPGEMHEKLASIFIESEKLEVSRVECVNNDVTCDRVIV